jgi:putative MFS transporter
METGQSSKGIAPQSLTLYDKAKDELDKIKTRNKAFYIIIMLVVFGTFFDAIEQYNAGYASNAVSTLFHLNALTISTQVEFITFSFMAIGAIIAGVMGDYLGRRFLYSFNLLIYAVGALISALAINYDMYLLGRIVVGLGLGGEIAVGLTLISEVVPLSIRGQYTGLVNVGPGFGIFAVAAIAVIFLGPFAGVFGGALVSWRWFLGILIIPALLVLFYRRYIPETPRFLISKGKSMLAFKVIKMLSENKLYPMSTLDSKYKDEDIENQYHIAGLSSIYEKPSIKDIFAGIYLKRSVYLIILSFVTFGVTASLTISYPFLFAGADATLHLSTTFYLTSLINFGTLLGTLTAAYLGKFSRRKVLTILGILAALFLGLTIVDHAFAYALVFSLFLYALFGYASNTSIWLYSPELYPTRARNIGTGLILVSSLAGVAVMLLIVTSIYSAYGLVGLGVLGLVLYLVYSAIMWSLGTETSMKDLEMVSP